MIEVIVEAGVNHGGSLDQAIAMIGAAAIADADVIKFQTFDPNAMLRVDDPDFKFLESLALPRNDFVMLARHCETIGLEFMSTPGDVDSLKFLVEECGVKRIKIGSDDLMYEPLVNAAVETGLPVILSTGMACMTDILVMLRRLPPGQHKLTLMHCVSLYPCPPDKANLRAIRTLKELGYRVGYSDHTVGDLACHAAVGLGAKIIEKHFRLTNQTGCADASVSITERELIGFVRDLRILDLMLGSGAKTPCKEEIALIPRLRKGADGKRGQQYSFEAV